MVLGGLVSKNETYAQSKIPLLGDLPIIGSFFRSRTKNNTDSELLIFVTPTIIEDNEYRQRQSPAVRDSGACHIAGVAQVSP